MQKSKKSKKSNSWKIKQHRDQFFKKSKTLGYRSRASFKLIELNQKFKFIKKNSTLLDLGSSPGGWTQVASISNTVDSTFLDGVNWQTFSVSNKGAASPLIPMDSSYFHTSTQIKFEFTSYLSGLIVKAPIFLNLKSHFQFFLYFH